MVLCKRINLDHIKELPAVYSKINIKIPKYGYIYHVKLYNNSNINNDYVYFRNKDGLQSNEYYLSSKNDIYNVKVELKNHNIQVT